MIRRSLILLLAFAAVATAAGTTAPPAAAQVPCWKQLINDWYDGRIDNTYPASCYREAIRNLPDDVDAYTEAREDINRALLAAVRSHGGELGDDEQIPPEPRSPQSGGDDGDADLDGDGIPDDEGDEVTAAPGGDPDEGGLIAYFRPSNADSIPLPLIVLAAFAMLLLATAAAGFVARRLQARRAPRQGQAPPDA